jgi:hypothetical protein
MKNLILTSLFVLGTACTTPRTETPKTRPDTVKPGAPTTVENIKLDTSSGVIQVHFDGAGENVAIRVSALDGLTLTSNAEAHSGLTVKAGDELSVPVTFTRGPGRGQLVLSVSGTFNGAQQSRVHTVAVGEGPLKDDGSKVQVTSDGDAVKLMP